MKPGGTPPVPSCEHGKTPRADGVPPGYQGMCCLCLGAYARTQGIFFERKEPDREAGQ